MGYGVKAAEWVGGISVVLCCGQWMAAYRTAVPLAHANQLPLPGL